MTPSRVSPRSPSSSLARPKSVTLGMTSASGGREPPDSTESGGSRPPLARRTLAGRAAHVAAVPLVVLDVFGELVAGHADQQADQLLRLVGVEVADGGPHEEAGQHRLQDVHRVEDAPQ